MTDLRSISLEIREVGENVFSISQDIFLLMNLKLSDDEEGIKKIKHGLNLVDNILSILTCLSALELAIVDNQEGLINEVNKIKFSCYGLQTALSKTLEEGKYVQLLDRKYIVKLVSTIKNSSSKLITISYLLENPDENCNDIESYTEQSEDVCYKDRQTCEQYCSNGFCVEDKTEKPKESDCMCPEYTETFTESSLTHVENGFDDDDQKSWHVDYQPSHLGSVGENKVYTIWEVLNRKFSSSKGLRRDRNSKNEYLKETGKYEETSYVYELGSSTNETYNESNTTASTTNSSYITAQDTYESYKTESSTNISYETTQEIIDPDRTESPSTSNYETTQDSSESYTTESSYETTQDIDEPDTTVSPSTSNYETTEDTSESYSTESSTNPSYETTQYTYESYTTESPTTPSYETTTQDMYKLSQDIYQTAQDLSSKSSEISSMSSEISSKSSDISSLVSELNNYEDDELSKKIQGVSKLTQEINSKTSEISSLTSMMSSHTSDISSASSDITSADRHHAFRTTPWQKMSSKCDDLVTSAQGVVTSAQDILAKVGEVVEATAELKVAATVANMAGQITSKTQRLIADALSIVSRVIELASVIESS